MKFTAGLSFPLSYFIKRIHWNFRLIPQKYQHLILYKENEIVDNVVLEMHQFAKDYEPETWDDCDRYEVRIVNYDYIKDLDLILTNHGVVCKSIQHQNKIRAVYDKTTGYFTEAPKTLSINMEKEIKNYIAKEYPDLQDLEFYINESTNEIIFFLKWISMTESVIPSACTDRVEKIFENWGLLKDINNKYFTGDGKIDYYYES